MRQFLSLFFVAAMVSACSPLQSHTEIEALNEAKTTGSPFTQRLTQEYKAYVKQKQRALDYSDARHFARKGLLAASGKVVMPEPLSNWHLDDKSAAVVRASRNDLMGVLNGGARVQAPVEAAIAQARFDCWIEQQEQNWQSDKPGPCKAQFEQAMRDIKARFQTAMPKSEKAGLPVPAKQAVKNEAPVVDPNAIRAGLDEGMFLVFFDFDRSTLNDSGNQVINAIAEQALKRNDLKSITIVGHADTSGSDKYNQRLSQRRADAVRTALAAQGVDVAVLHTEGRGESAPMVATPNNTREPANRRVEVTFE